MPGSCCSTTRPAASTSAPSRRCTSCCASWPTPARRSCSTSTDYDELIGCCDRVAILYDGRIVRELAGAAITEHNIVASALNLPLDAAVEAVRAAMRELRLWLGQNYGPLLAIALFVADVRDLHRQPLGRPDRAGGHHRRQQGRAAGAGRDGADPADPDRRARSLGRHGVHPRQLPRVDDRRRARPLETALGVVVVLARRRARRASSTAASWSTAACSRSSRRSRPARSTTASRSGSGRSRAATCRRTSPTS